MVMGYPLEKWEIHWRLEILENVILHLMIFDWDNRIIDAYFDEFGYNSNASTLMNVHAGF